MERPKRWRRPEVPFWLALAALCLATTVAFSACGGDDACSGEVVVTGGTAECESVANEYQCSSFELNGDVCSVYGCDVCNDIVDDDDDDDF
jgi:hypothetical protein